MTDHAERTAAGRGADGQPEEPTTAVGRLAAKARRIAESELGPIHPRIHLASMVSRGLPQFAFNRLRTGLYRAAGLQIGEGTLIMGELIITGAGDWATLLTFGKDSYVSGPLRVNLASSVTIGDNVNLGHDVALITVNHTIGTEDRRAGISTSAPIVIEHGVWIGSRATVLPGVRVGAGAIVAAGAMVTHDVPPNTLVGGVPARVLKPLDPEGVPPPLQAP